MRRIYQYFATFSGLLAILIAGMVAGWPSPSLPKFVNGNTTSFHISSSHGSWIAVMHLIGGIFISFFASTIIDKFGRKWSMIITAVPFFAGWMFIAFGNSTTFLFVARFLAGLAEGMAFIVMPLYIGEIADPKIRGFLGASLSTSWMFGALLINIIGGYLSIRLTALICALFPVLFLSTFVWMPESPYWFIMKENYDKARISLKKLKGNDNVETELDRLKEVVKRTQCGKFSDLFCKRENQRALIIIAILLNGTQLCGFSAITFYTQTIFIQAGQEFLSPLTATIILYLVQVIVTGISSLLVDRVGRRILLITSSIGTSLALFLVGIYLYIKSFTDIDVSSLSFIPLVTLVGYIIIYNLGMPVPLIMLGELFPINVKNNASCLQQIYYSVLATMVAKFFQLTSDAFGMYLPFTVFGACSLINLVFIILYVPETKGKTIEEVQEDLGKIKIQNSNCVN